MISIKKRSCFYLAIFFQLLYLCIAIIGTVKYFRLKDIVDTSESINYQVIGKREVYGRGMRYEMKVDFASMVYDVNITSSTYYDIDQGIQPKLYYNPAEDIVFSQWTVRLFFRVSIVFSVLFIGASIFVLRQIRRAQKHQTSSVDRLSLLIVSCLLFSSCQSTEKLHSIEDAMSFLDQQKGAELSIEKLTSHLAFQRIDTFVLGDRNVSYKIFFSDVILNAKDICWLTIDYNKEDDHIIDYYKTCQ